MIYIGIDPGGGGGLAAIDDNGVCIETRTMPATERDTLDTIAWLGFQKGDEDRRAALEHVWSIPGQGGAFKFGLNVGTLRTALTAARIPFDLVLPKRWQKLLGVSYPPGSTDTEKKNITKRRAQQLFPQLTITHAIADALLLAEYCRRLERGDQAATSRRTDGKEEGSEKEGQAGRAQSRRRLEERQRSRQTAHAAATAAGADRGRADQAARRLRRVDR